MVKWVKETLNKTFFDLEEFRQDYKKITNFDEIQENLDECLITLNNVQGSRYVSTMKEHVDTLHAKFIVIIDSIEAWKQVQRTWLYLYSIFDVSKDIKEYTKNKAGLNNRETYSFSDVSDFWKKTLQ